MATLSEKIDFDGYWREKKISGIPSNSGVYCVYTCVKTTDGISIDKLIYIGESGNVNERIKNHEKWDEWKKYLKKNQEICFSFAPIESSKRDRIEAALIYTHKPPVNTDYIDSFPFDKTTIATSGKNKFIKSSFIVERDD